MDLSVYVQTRHEAVKEWNNFVGSDRLIQKDKSTEHVAYGGNKTLIEYFGRKTSRNVNNVLGLRADLSTVMYIRIA